MPPRRPAEPKTPPPGTRGVGTSRGADTSPDQLSTLQATPRASTSASSQARSTYRGDVPSQTRSTSSTHPSGSQARRERGSRSTSTSRAVSPELLISALHEGFQEAEGGAEEQRGESTDRGMSVDPTNHEATASDVAASLHKSAFFIGDSVHQLSAEEIADIAESARQLVTSLAVTGFFATEVPDAANPCRRLGEAIYQASS